MSSPHCSYGEEDLLPITLGQPVSFDLRAHVAGCPDCQQRLQELQSESSTIRKALQPADVTVGSLASIGSEPDNRSPGTIGKYFVVGMLGEGSQAVAYRALHPVLHKELVIKHAKKLARGEPKDHDLLLREGRILASLEHPNIARVIDLDFHDGRPFLVMEYHRGVNLTQFALGHKLHPREIAALLAPVARALEAAHRLGIIHRDIKPSNILIDDRDRPFVLDFGLARLKDAWNAGADQPAGGTAAYMSPEQAY